jgi:hypothetical protein
MLLVGTACKGHVGTSHLKTWASLLEGPSPTINKWSWDADMQMREGLDEHLDPMPGAEDPYEPDDGTIFEMIPLAHLRAVKIRVKSCRVRPIGEYGDFLRRDS